MKLKDNTTLSIAAAVSDVVEGRVKKEEAKYPHDMFHPETGAKKVAKDEAEHNALADQGYTHEKPEVDEVAEPKAKGEKDFKAKHTVKKTYGPGAVKEEDEGEEEEVDEALQPVTKIRFDYKDTMPKSPKPSDVGGLKQDWKSEKMSVQGAVKSLGGLVTDSEAPSKSNKFVGTISIGTRGDASKLSNAAIQKAVKSKGAEIQSNQFESVVEVEEETIEEGKFPKALLKKATDLALKMGGNMTGAVKKIEKMKKGLSDDPEVKAALQLANEEVTEEVVAEAHAMNEAKSKMAEDKERYQKFFKSALKKFGVTSPGELEGEKKKEFFNYVDKNYEADNETDKDESVKEDTIAEAQIRTSFEADEMKNVGGDKAAKKMKIKISFKKGKGDGYGGSDAGIFTGDEKNLVKYFQDYMGFEGKTFKELQKEYS